MNMMIAALAAAVPFVSTVITDPIDDSRLLAFAAGDDRNLLFLACHEGKNEIIIRFIPDRYYGRPSNLFASGPKAISRFSKAEPMQVGWYFDDTAVEFVGGAVRGNQQKAAFIDQLSRDTTFTFRYAVDERRIDTQTINYTIDPADLGRFMAKCNPKSVNQYLREWDSPAAPREPSK